MASGMRGAGPVTERNFIRPHTPPDVETLLWVDEVPRSTTHIECRR